MIIFANLFAQFISRTSAMFVIGIFFSVQALALPADGGPVTYIPELSDSVAKACATRAHTGGLTDATVIASQPATIKIDCSLGHIEMEPTDECIRNCGYEDLRSRTVRLTNQTIAALRAAGCADISTCSEGVRIGSLGSPSRLVEAWGAGAPVATLKRDAPPLEVAYGDDVRAYWVIDARGNKPVKIWNVIIRLFNNAKTETQGAIFISRISLIFPDMRRDIQVPMVCNRVWIVNDRYLQQLGAFKADRSIFDVVRALASSRVPRKVC